jgi:methionyl-tRNA synthetase
MQEEKNLNKNGKISIEEFAKVDIRVGKILSVEKVENTDKLLKLSVNLGEEIPRQIISGISKFFPDTSILVGKKCMFVANLEPREIRGLKSDGMIVALSTDDGKFSLLSPNDDIPEGTSIR